MDISASLVKELRDKTGVGIMDCKEALKECDGDISKAVDYLRKKGIATAKKRGGRVAAEGQVQSYIHGGGKIGVLVEVNCETDFSGKTGDFTEFVKNISMQIAATNPAAIDREGIPADVLNKEKEIYASQVVNKPPEIVEKIVVGKLDKFYADNCLLEQIYVKDPEQKKNVQDMVIDVVAKLGENIVIKRFVRFQLGENIS